VFSDRKVLMLYASGAVAAEGKMSEEHMTIMKGRLE
jgi:lysophospholipase